jgi:hypothetical protein
MLGMYVHTHWAYHHPYAARTWTEEDWRGYLEGLAALGYDMVMIWPQLECMASPPNASDRAFLEKLGGVIRFAHDRLGMKVFITAGVNIVGNENAARYALEERPYFVCERKIDPRDAAAVRALVAERRRQFEAIRDADAVVFIDSDPGGYIGSTNAEFVALIQAQLGALRDLNPRLELVYWMWVGWENYNRFWATAARWQPGDPEPAISWDAACFADTLTRMREQVPEPWSVLASAPGHFESTDDLGLGAKRLFNPYGSIEGEPTFPLTNVFPEALAEVIGSDAAGRCPRGIMANAQTHVLQLPNTYLFAHFARGGTHANADLAGFADRLVPGRGRSLAEAWGALAGREPSAQRVAAAAIRTAVGQPHRPAPLGGLLFGDPDRFLTDLAANLDLRAALSEFGATPEASTLRKVLQCLYPYQQRLGFVDAYMGPLAEELNKPLARLGDAAIDGVLQQFQNWRNPSVRNGVLPRLLAAVEDYCRRHG